MDQLELDIKKNNYESRVNYARAIGDKELHSVIYDPNTFIIGTSHMDHFKSTHKRNQAKTLQLKEEKSNEIQRRNQILLEKLVDSTSTIKAQQEPKNNETKRIIQKAKKEKKKVKTKRLNENN